MSSTFDDFCQRFKILASKRQDLVTNTLSNIFTMRLVGNKTHGDLAEIGIEEFINQFMYDFSGKHVGKDLFRAKEHEEDIKITNELTKQSMGVSLKAYGDGPLQLSTDKNSLIFPKLQEFGDEITNLDTISDIFNSAEFKHLNELNLMPLIYREADKQCNIMVFDFAKMRQNTAKILFIDKNHKYDFSRQEITHAKGRKHPIYLFIDGNGGYICEVRYGGAAANALQRGFWTHTIHAKDYFNSLTNGWISYEHNLSLVKLLKLALNATAKGHEQANEILQQNINSLQSKPQ